MIVRGTALVCALTASGASATWARTEAPPPPDVVYVAALDPQDPQAERQGDAVPSNAVAQLPPFPSPRDTGDVSSPFPTDFPLPWDLDLRFRSLFRSDNLDWTVGGIDPEMGVWSSELSWENLRAWGGQAEGRIQFEPGFVIAGRANVALITAGDNQDSDFMGGTEFNRSNNSADEGHAYDASLGFGWAFDLVEFTGIPLTLTPLGGWSYHTQELSMSDGLDTIVDGQRAAMPFSGLDSEYATSWHGPWVGIQMHMEPAPGWTLSGAIEHHWVFRYDAEADWNLRPDIEAFEHSATGGSGFLLRGALSYRLSGRWTFDLNAQWSDFETRSGKDTIFWNGGGRADSDLDGVNWDSIQLSLGARYQF